MAATTSYLIRPPHSLSLSFFFMPSFLLTFLQRELVSSHISTQIILSLSLSNPSSHNTKKMKTNMRTKIVNHSPPFRRLHQGALFEPSSQIAEIETLVSNPSTMKFLGALLVNIARGGLLDYEAVHYHLKSGHLGGLGMDVAWTEPFDPDNPILKLSNVLITPHVAGVTEHSYRTTAKVVGDVALQFHAGTPFTGIEFVN